MIALLALVLPQVDPVLPDYAPQALLTGTMTSAGSDTMNNLMTLWVEAFQPLHPGFSMSIEGRGGRAPYPAALGKGLQLQPMSRPLKESERLRFSEKRGHEPTEVRVAWDALAVFVHKDNPIRSLTLDQVDAIFSKTRRRGLRGIRTWGDLGLEGEWADKPVSLYGRNSTSGTYGYFKEAVLKNGDFKDEVKEQPGSASVVLGVATDRYAVGYSPIAYAISTVRAVPLAAGTGDAAVEPTGANAKSDRYPISRPLRIAIDREPGRACDLRVREFLRFVLSRQGQALVAKDGCFPLTPAQAAEERKKIE
jgi:phosphate transport system substrate-binding protein